MGEHNQIPKQNDGASTTAKPSSDGAVAPIGGGLGGPLLQRKLARRIQRKITETTDDSKADKIAKGNANIDKQNAQDKADHARVAGKAKTTGASFGVTVSGHDVLVFLPKGGAAVIDPKMPIDVFMFFHGKGNDYAQGGNAASNSHLADAVAASGKNNLIGIAPDVGANASGGWSALGSGDFSAFADAVLVQLSSQLTGAATLALGNVRLVGHSAGGVPLGQAATDFGDAVTDVTLQDAGYSWDSWLTSWRKLREWFLSAHDFKKKAARTVRVITKDGPGAAGAVDSTRSVLSLKDGLNKASLVKRIAELAADPANAHLKGATVSESAYGDGGANVDKTKRPGDMKLESQLDVTTTAGALGTIYVFAITTHHDGVKDLTMGGLPASDNNAGAGFEASGPTALGPALQPGEFIVTAPATVRTDDDLTANKIDDSDPKKKNKTVTIPVKSQVKVTDYQHGPLKDAKPGQVAGYGLYANVEGWGWTLYSNLKAAPAKP